MQAKNLHKWLLTGTSNYVMCMSLIVKYVHEGTRANLNLVQTWRMLTLQLHWIMYM